MAGKLTQRNGKRLAGGKPLPSASFALPGQRYPVDTIRRARNALARIAQNGTPAEKAKVRSAVQRRYQSIGVSQANGRGPAIELAQLQCPNCGYRSDDGDFTVSGGTADTDDPAKPSALRTPSAATPKKAGFSPQQVTVKAANSRGGIELARRVPVTSAADIVVSRTAGGPAIIRHRQGGAAIAEMRRNDDGTWQTVVDGKPLSLHTQQRAALMEALGTWNKGAAAERPALPLAGPPPQTPAMTALGITNVRAFASDDDDDDDDDDSDDGADANGLTPRGAAIHAKLKKKGVAPKVALAMAKRAQATKPGQFGKAG
jgi:hypothetical protein